MHGTESASRPFIFVSKSPPASGPHLVELRNSIVLCSTRPPLTVAGLLSLELISIESYPGVVLASIICFLQERFCDRSDGAAAGTRNAATRSSNLPGRKYI